MAGRKSAIEIAAWIKEEGALLAGNGRLGGVRRSLILPRLARPDNITSVTLGAELDRIGLPALRRSAR